MKKLKTIKFNWIDFFKKHKKFRSEPLTFLNTKEASIKKIPDNFEFSDLIDGGKMFSSCTSLNTLADINFADISKLVHFTEMNINQIKFCQEKGLVSEHKREVAKQLNLCPFFAIIDKNLIGEFENLKSE